MTSLNLIKVKQIVEERLQQDLNYYKVFIETGTLIADTLVNLHPYFNHLHSIELSEKYYNLSKERISNLNLNNITLHFGDSSKVIPKLLNTLTTKDKCIFFLDGHWSSGDTAKGKKDCPLIEECEAIDSLYSAKSAILIIDDLRLFDTHFNENWRGITIDNIKQCFKYYSIINECIFDDKLSLHIEQK